MTEIKPISARLGLEVLSPEQLAEIKSATLSILETVGVHFPSQRALEVFSEHGAEVDTDTQLVRMSPDFVCEAISLAPRSYGLSGRAAGTDLMLNGRSSYFTTDGCGTQTIDFETGEQRRSCKEDVAVMARVADYLSSIAFYWPMISARDYGHLAPLHELEAAYHNTCKHVQTETVVDATLARYAIRMAEVIAGSKETLKKHPPLSSLICTIAPMGQDAEGIEAAMEFAEAGIPVGFMAMPTMGTTAPSVPGGALVVGNAEVTSAMVLMQLVAPGAPVFFSLLASVMDPMTADYIVSTPEKYLCNAAAVQIAHDWGVPCLAGAFGLDYPEPASWELGRDSVYSALLSALAGADLVVGLGMLQATTVLVPEQIIFDDEIYHIHRRLVQGLDTSAAGLALEVISAVGPRGHYLAQRHTRDHVGERWIPGLTHPRSGLNEQDLGDIRQRARAKFDKILAGHQPEPLEQTAQAELRAILEAAQQELA
jgi:trimethylamine--corrinoid protein Co-methyltransferase